jgi:hypothetical protein
LTLTSERDTVLAKHRMLNVSQHVDHISIHSVHPNPILVFSPQAICPQQDAFQAGSSGWAQHAG